MRPQLSRLALVVSLALGVTLPSSTAPDGGQMSPPPASARAAVTSPLPNTFGWQDELVDDAGFVGRAASLTVDSVGYPHIAYYDFTTDSLKYAAWDGVAWTVDTVEAGIGSFLDHSDMFVSQSKPGIAVYGNTAYLVYEKFDDNTHRRYLRYAVGGPGSWLISTLSPADNTNDIYAPSLRIDTLHDLHLSYALGDHTYYQTSIIYARLNHTSTTWLAQTVDVLPEVHSVPFVTSLALDSSNHPQIAYGQTIAEASSPVNLARWNAGTWLKQTVAISAGLPSLAVDFVGYAHIAYRLRDQNYDVEYASWTGSAWLTEAVPMGGCGVDTPPKLALDPLDHPHILWDNCGLHLAHWDGVTWQTETLTDSSVDPSEPALALDSVGNPHIAYRDARYRDLHYVTWASKWQTQTVTLNGGEPSLAVDRRNIPYISYNDGSLRLAKWAGVADWHVSTVSPSGLYNSLQLLYGLNLQPMPTLSYQDSQFRLELANWNGATFVTRTVGSASDVGFYSSLDLNGPKPAIAHFDFFNYRLRYAEEVSPNVWSDLLVLATPPLDFASADHSLSLGVAPNGASYIAYRDAVSQTLRMATRVGAVWVDELVDGTGNTGFHASLAVDRASGQAAIAYYDATHQTLKYAYQHGNWTVTEVDTGLQDVTGISLQLALGSNQYPRIAYTAQVSNSLRLAWTTAPTGTWQIETVATLAGAPSVGVASRVQARDHIAFSLPTTGVGYAFRSATLPYSLYYNPLQPCVDNQPQFASYGHALAQVRALAPAALAQVDDLTTLRAVRDLFALSSGGQHYINLYYQHAPETGRLAVADPSLLWDAYRTLQNFMPGLQALATGQGGSIVITQAMVDEVNDIADRLVAAGSPALGSAINTERAKYNHLQAFVGHTFDGAAKLLGVASHAVYLPVIRR